MNSNLTIFNFKEKQVRTYIDEIGNIWFCAKDVCDVLEIKNPSDTLSKSLKKEGIEKVYIQDDTGFEQLTNFINEPNLYRLIMRSNKPEADKFQDWVTEEVLPSIRKTGSYNINGQAQKRITKAQEELEIAKAQSERSFGSRIIGVGRGKAVRGKRKGANRPDLLIFDDIQLMNFIQEIKSMINMIKLKKEN